MESGKLVFAQLMDFVPRHDFDACPRQFQGLFFCFSWGCQRPISAARMVTLWTLPNGPSLLHLEHTSLSGIAFLSGPTCDRANRVTQACRLKRIASEHDRRSGRIGDFTDHLCPCPSILRWARGRLLRKVAGQIGGVRFPQSSRGQSSYLYIELYSFTFSSTALHSAPRGQFSSG